MNSFEKLQKMLIGCVNLEKFNKMFIEWVKEILRRTIYSI